MNRLLKGKNRFAYYMLMLSLLSALPLKAQMPTYSKEVEAKIKKVERSLGEAIKTSDHPLYLLDRMKEYNIHCVSIAVITDNKLEWARAYGFADTEQSIPATTETMFQAASISKSLNAMGILKLVQENKLALDVDINTYLTDWKFPYDSSEWIGVITLKQLLSHTAGTSVHGFRGYAKGEDIPDITQILNGEEPANNRAIRSVFRPGSKPQYSGGGITISQKIVQELTGQPYDMFMKANILDPLEMKASFYSTVPPESLTNKLASGYLEDGNPVKGKYHLYPEQAAASLWTNPTELSNFIIELQKSNTGKSNKILKKEMVHTMLTPVMAENALGVFIKTVANNKYFSHGGANEGFRSFFVGNVDEGNGVVVMVNSNNSAILAEIVNSVATVYGWKDYYNPVVRKTVKVAEEVLDSYAGVYEVSPGFAISITRKKEALFAQATNQAQFPLFPEEPNKFFFKVVEASLEFIKDDSGRISHLILHQNGQSIPANKK